MAKNRVEELETTVAELESTVKGLTDELVEAKERIRQLERHVEGDVPSGAVRNGAATQGAEQTPPASGATGDTGVEVETAPETPEADAEDADAAAEADAEPRQEDALPTGRRTEPTDDAAYVEDGPSDGAGTEAEQDAVDEAVEGDKGGETVEDDESDSELGDDIIVA